MTTKALIGARILAQGAWLDDHAVVISDGQIANVLPVADIESGPERVTLKGGILLPGFIDTQVNGGGGVLLNDVPTVAGIRAIAAAHRTFGTTGLLPTLISDDLDVVAAAIAAVDDAIVAGVPGVLGIHIEGPFLNPGKRGIHDATKFRTLDHEAVALLSSLKQGKTLVTLAPESLAAGMIKTLVESGVIIAAGHTLATYDQMQWAFDQGVTGVTHLFNAMTQLDSRAPGVVGAALSDPRCLSGLIVDGHHVHPAALRLALKARGPEGLMLVTDAMPSVGSGQKHFLLAGQTISAENGVCRAADGTLAGSDLDMATAFRNAITMMNVDIATASRMASGTPATFLGLSHRRGDIASGFSADLVHLDGDLRVTATWIDGVREDVM
jgi:N-acetylglucosamine-6-phosphate deacetylase